ncbi:MAG: tRNA (N6-isopentenyl adenosine(37)-C2)-methylthiotransferase MiaB [Parachlamydiales bacterium]|jgi:tRNA-2-methylthio-N6-dimethylallyladenosine synthase
MDKLKTFLLRTYGCQMNELDSEYMRGQLLKRGLTETADEEKADLVIFNTCSIRDLAERKVLGKIGLMLRKQKRPFLGVAGCMPMLKKEKLLKKFPEIDFLLGPGQLEELDQIIDGLIAKKAPLIHLENPKNFFSDYKSIKRSSKIKAYVPIMQGCNNFCTYCVVPYSRGREISRPLNDILEECRYLKDSGYQEITLLGQNVNSYQSEKKTFADLLYSLDKLNFPRIRFLTSHPKDLSLDLIEALRDLKSLCEHLHLPLQAGSNRILKLMNRSYTAEAFLEKAELLKARVPSMTFGTDLIVGFPSETPEDFEKTLDVFKQVRFANAFIYAYSPRKGTKAYLLKDDVAQTDKARRLQQALKLFEQIQKEENPKYLQKTVEVLVERTTKEAGFLKGKTRDLKKVIFPGPENLIGSLQKIKLEKFSYQTFIGSL